MNELPMAALASSVHKASAFEISDKPRALFGGKVDVLLVFFVRLTFELTCLPVHVRLSEGLGLTRNSEDSNVLVD